MTTSFFPPIGELKGTITWFRGEVPITLGSGVPGSIIGVNDAISIEPITVKISPPTEEGSFGTTVETPIHGTAVKFGRISVVHSKIGVAYTVSNLPLGIAIQLRVRPRQVEGTFRRTSNPQDTVLEIQQLVVNDFDFEFLAPPK